MPLPAARSNRQHQNSLHPFAQQSQRNQRSRQAEGPGKASRIRHADQTFDIYTVDYPKEKIRLFWKDDKGNKLKSIDSLKAYVEGKEQRLVFATNAGMYMEDFFAPGPLH